MKKIVERRRRGFIDGAGLGGGTLEESVREIANAAPLPPGAEEVDAETPLSEWQTVDEEHHPWPPSPSG